MKVILLEDIKGVGKKDSIVNASDGYVRNYLFPKKLAIEANKINMAKLNAKNNSKQYKKDQEKKAAEEIAKKLEKILVKIEVKAGTNGKIFGGVAAKEIADILKKDYNITVDKKKIDLKETIKKLGVHVVEIKLFEGVIGKVKIDVISE